MDAWIIRLKAAVDSGYYRAEEAREEQVSFPWQNKTCRDCPFWANSICQVFADYRGSMTHTCGYFDPWNHAAAERRIQTRQWQGFRRWWEWYNDRGASR